MRRWIFLILFLLVLIAPFIVRAVIPTETGPTIARNAPRLVIVTPHNQDIRREFARAFSQWHQTHYGTPVDLDYRMPGGANDIKRVLETMYRAYLLPNGTFSSNFSPDYDIIWGGGDYFFDRELKQLFDYQGKKISILQPLNLDPKLLHQAFPDSALAGVKLYDDTAAPQWVGVCLASYGIVYNPDLYRSLNLAEPQTWNDLSNPRLSGMVALADPAHAGSAAVAYMVILQRAMADAESELFALRPEIKNLPKPDLKTNPAYQSALSTGWKKGMSRLLLIAANARYFTASATQVPNDVGTGDAAAGVAIDFYGRVYEEVVGSSRCRFVLPEGATSITPDPVGILYGVQGDRKTLATHFVEFLLTPEAQRLWALKPGQPGGPVDRALRRLPVRRDMYANRTGWADDSNPFEQARGFNQRAEWMGLFADTRPIWTAAWIDSRDALHEAYARILRESDQSKREQLLSDLANLPVDLKDIVDIRTKRTSIESAHGDIDLWKARQRIDWANRFRDHYRGVGEKAS
jgi:iron(III) transport system substrate-binding protein